MDKALEARDLAFLEEQLARSIQRIARAMEMTSQALVVQVGLTLPQLSVLQAISKFHPATSTGLARHLCLSQSTVSGILSRLRSKKLVKGEEYSADRRVRRYRLTPRGVSLLEVAAPLLGDRILKKFRKIETYERNGVLAALRLVASFMDGNDCSLAHRVHDLPQLLVPRLNQAIIRTGSQTFGG
ncbi:MAG: winged helix-turn-helix transcriptional regulator [Candidatus Eremiobacteraeota bacterium]|nr:winged helix-turn-helix transcriptional regulator [Candidatus Eremiobacteraeota bacterium]